MGRDPSTAPSSASFHSGSAQDDTLVLGWCLSWRLGAHALCVEDERPGFGLATLRGKLFALKDKADAGSVAHADHQFAVRMK